MTDRIKEFLARNPEDGPRLVVDLDVVRENYLSFAKALPDTRVFYAVKANPAPEILDLLARLGSCFDTASVVEIEQALAAGATPDRISFGNTIKKERDIARAYALGVRLYRGRLRGRGREDRARRAGLEGVLPHPVRRRGRGMAAVAQVRLRAGDGGRGAGARAPARARRAWAVVPCRLAAAQPAHVGRRAEGLGRDLPRARRARHPACDAQSRRRLSRPAISRTCRRCATYGQTIFRALRRHFGNRIPETIIEPGRGMVGNAGVIEAEVVLISRKSEDDAQRWVYLDIGKFNGLAETMDEMIRYPIRTDFDEDAHGALRASRGRAATPSTCSTRRSRICCR